MYNRIELRTKNTIECLNREIKRRTKEAGTHSVDMLALMLECARFCHKAGFQ